MPNTIFSVKNVTKYFGKKKAVDNVSFDVNEGEIFGFLGPNGAGKSTTIKIALGLLSADEGHVIIDGYDVKKDFEKAIKNVGGIIENPEMYNYLSGTQNLKIYANMHTGVKKQDIEDAVKLVHLENRISDKVKKYSLGMKQRIGLAQAIMHNPKVLILDEPTNGLDPAGIKELRDILKKLAHEKNVAIIVSSHLMSEMQLMCDKVAIIDNGRLLGVYTLGEITNMSESVFRIRVNNFDDFYGFAQTKYKGKIKTSGQDYIDISASEDQISSIIKDLALNDIMIFEVIKQKNSLEDAFIKITGGGKQIE